MIRVLVVDDSALVRKVLSEQLSSFEDIEVVGTAIDPYAARERIAELEPDVMTLDIEMPRMDGLSFLAKLMKHHPIPVVIVSSVAPENSEEAVRALRLGAVEVVPKPGSHFSVPDVGRRLVKAIRTASVARVGKMSGPVKKDGVQKAQPLSDHLRTTHRIIGIGASTGGTRALERLLEQVPPNAPGIAIVQHMPAGFTASFAERLDSLLDLTVREATDGERLVPGMVLIAPGGRHLMVERNGAVWVARVRSGPAVNRHRPSVDVLFRSLARNAGDNALGIILTGMGGDGAAGLLEMKKSGAHTVAQDELTSVVWGMPKVAIEMGAVDDILPLDGIPAHIRRHLDPDSNPAALSGAATGVAGGV